MSIIEINKTLTKKDILRLKEILNRKPLGVVTYYIYPSIWGKIQRDLGLLKSILISLRSFGVRRIKLIEFVRG